MILTGKSLEAFEIWYINHIRQREDIGDRYFDNTLLRTFWDSGLLNQNSFIIDWFDSVGIYIDSTHSLAFDRSISFHSKVNMMYVTHGIKYQPINIFKNRKLAIEKAIEVANQIYNERNR